MFRSGCVSFQKGIPEMESLLQPVEDPKKAEALLQDLLAANLSNKQDLAAFMLQARKRYRMNLNNIQLLHLYRNACLKGTYTYDARYEELFQAKQFRSQSGVLVIAVFTSPYPETVKDGQIVQQTFSCEYDCFYCPQEPNQPRSYLMSEPGVARANANQFDPVGQFTDRANTYVRMGHPIDKIELLVLGGTWSSYPRDYQDAFLRDIYYAANTYFDSEKRPRRTVEEEIEENEKAECRIIGVTLETRPDRVNAAELQNFRRLGVTRIQMGAQHTEDRILQRVNRKCTSAHLVRALRLAKDCCFKVDIHLMPDLPQPFREGVSPLKYSKQSMEDYEGVDPTDIDWDFDMVEADRRMFWTVLEDPDYQADQWKIYPCEVTKWTRIEKDYARGSYKPYGHQTDPKQPTPLFDLLLDVMTQVKPWIRLNRVIRDIPNHEILAGNMNVSMRDTLDITLRQRGLRCMDIRSREVKKRTLDPSSALLRTRSYEASGGIEYFLSFESEDETVLFGFLRLRITNNPGAGVFPELEGCALIRELHVYGQVKKVNTQREGVLGSAQHAGLGRRLLEAAETLTQRHQLSKMAVISGVGVKEYYRKQGFADEGAFLVKHIPVPIPPNYPGPRVSYVWVLTILYAVTFACIGLPLIVIVCLLI